MVNTVGHAVIREERVKEWRLLCETGRPDQVLARFISEADATLNFDSSAGMPRVPILDSFTARAVHTGMEQSSINRILNRWQGAGILTKDRHGIVIAAPLALGRLSPGGPHPFSLGPGF